MLKKYGFPRYHVGAIMQILKSVWWHICHPSRQTLNGITTRGSLTYSLWWHFADVGWAAAWRPICWWRGYHIPHHCDVYFEMCIICAKLLWSKTQHGMPNPFKQNERVSTSELRDYIN